MWAASASENYRTIWYPQKNTIMTPGLIHKKRISSHITLLPNVVGWKLWSHISIEKYLSLGLQTYYFKGIKIVMRNVIMRTVATVRGHEKREKKKII